MLSPATPHRLADVATQTAARIWADQPDAVGRWLCGELSDLDRWRLLMLLAELLPLEWSPGEFLDWLSETDRIETTEQILWGMP